MFNIHALNRLSYGIVETIIVANSFGADNIFTKIHQPQIIQLSYF